MPQGKCENCGRLIYDTEKVEELRDEMECQHCHHLNIIRVQPLTVLTISTGILEEAQVGVSIVVEEGGD